LKRRLKMAKPTKEQIKEFALSRGLDLFGVANIERFKDAPHKNASRKHIPRGEISDSCGKKDCQGWMARNRRRDILAKLFLLLLLRASEYIFSPIAPL